MKKAERDELQRQGAKAAARGDAAQCNPMLARRNRPAVTGENAQLWTARSDAWQSGFDAQTIVRDGSSAPDEQAAPDAEAAQPGEETPGKPPGVENRSERGA